MTLGKAYDIILDTIGKSNVGRTKGLLKKNGFYLFTTFGLIKLFRILWLQMLNRKKAFYGLLEAKPEDLDFLKEQIEAGKLISVIDKRYSFEEAAKAHSYVETGQKKGQVVITMSDESKA